MSEEKRIYVIVAETVQNELINCVSQDAPQRIISVSTTATKTIVQPKGRIAAQVAHVVSKMRLEGIRKYGVEPYTTIILGVPDSYNLQLRDFLLEQNKVPICRFRDTNDEYGPGSVKTAICTVPIERSKTGYALDYLTLWS